MNELYQWIAEYLEKNQYENAKKALLLSKERLNMRRGIFSTSSDTISCHEHGLKGTKLLIDLHVPLSHEDADCLYACMLCYDILDRVFFSKQEDALITDYQFPARMLSVLRLITRPDFSKDVPKEAYYQRLQEDPLAVLLVLADHSNLVEQLSDIAINDVNGFIAEMRSYVLPMAILAKQKHPEILKAITIMMEKVHCLIDVADIIVGRYQKRELAYTNEILSLMEENARLQGMIQSLQAP